MASIILDTGPFVMLLLGSERLTPATRMALSEGDTVFVSAISFYEIAQKSRLGKWPDVDDIVPHLVASANTGNIGVLPITADLALNAANLDWAHRDPFDRIIAATALSENMTCVSSDRAFDDVGVVRIRP
ncbi:type II toxin-antitoxin system VapC family toxin [Gymnodinialimonas ulvae]|uniref:type II toxin-antitoxin system VapC family toxin n=1 Tax=Gymnodinialimonas ulvae TaxID=3126504 RepID=UPI0030A84E5A